MGFLNAKTKVSFKLCRFYVDVELHINALAWHPNDNKYKPSFVTKRDLRYNIFLQKILFNLTNYYNIYNVFIIK